MPEPTLSFATPAEALAERTDAELLAALNWTGRAAGPLRKAATEGDVAKFTRDLGRRRCLVQTGPSGERIGHSLAGKPALWAVPAFEESARTNELAGIWKSFELPIKRPKGKRAAESYRRAKQNGAEPRNGKASSNWFARESQLAEWLHGVTAAVPLRPIELLILAEMLPAAGRELSPPLRWTLWRTVLTAGLEFAANLDEPPGSPVTDEQRLVIAGVLPVALGVLFAGIKGAGTLRKQGAGYLEQQLGEATDTDGTPSAVLVERLPLWLAAFTAARHWSALSSARFWKPETEERFADFVQAAMSMCRADGKLALSNGATPLPSPGNEANGGVAFVLQSAAASAGFRRKSLPMRLLSDVATAKSQGGKKRGPKVPKPSKGKKRKSATKQSAYGRPVAQSDWAKLACLRSGWDVDSDLLVVAHDGELPHLDLSAAGVPILDGAWGIDIAADGHPVELPGEWESVCWFSDRDVDYLEIQAKTKAGILIDRQIALSRKENYACLVDSVHGAGNVSLEYASRIPLAGDTEPSTDADTREILLSKTGAKVRCFPLSLPCDRVDSAAGEFAVEDESALRLTQRSAGGLVAPIVFDWSKKRRRKPADWRTLTVAEDGRRVGPDAAGGYSLRIGELYLVLYRGLKPTVLGRTLLGLHTRHETVIGNFTKAGEVEAVMLVEG